MKQRRCFSYATKKITIVPVTLHTENENTSATNPAVRSSNPACTIKTVNAEIVFLNGVLKENEQLFPKTNK
ncbi:hypothetical protein CWS01_02495 [Niallia nealsonii]|uniref:Uncharacterized protein n=1 Tax=Niallia nealsonii TaxID=115979 RepID=A0A2N0Z6Z1_9BACI|nr:hypothetical protein CWS01_02495 [Niallia nealsonii]